MDKNVIFFLSGEIKKFYESSAKLHISRSCRLSTVLHNGQDVFVILAQITFVSRSVGQI